MSESPERSERLFISILVFIIAAVLTGIFLVVVLSPTASWRSAELQAATKRFSENIMQARVEWMRTGQPADVFLSLAELTGEGTQQGRVRIAMSRDGWPQARSQGENACVELWQLLAAPGQLERDLSVSYIQQGRNGRCEFHYGGRLAFKFYPQSGQVEKVN